MFRSLRFKIALALIVINTLSFVAMSLINYETSNRQMNKELLRYSLSSLKSLTTNLSTMLSLRIKEAELIGHSIPVRLRTTEERLDFLKTAVPLTNLPARHVGIANRAGNMLLTNGRTISVAEMPAFKMALTGNYNYSNMMLDEEGYPVMWMMIPFYDIDYTLLGVIGIALDSNRLLDKQLDSIGGDYEDSLMILIDQDTNLLYHADKSLVLKRNYFRDEPGSHNIFEQMKSSIEGHGEAHIFGRMVKIFYVKMPERNWYAVYSIAKSEFEAPLRKSLWMNMTLIAITEVCLGTLLYLITQRSIISRLMQVVNVTRNVATGNFYPKPLEIRSQDEMGILATSVNGMIDNLQELFEPFQAFIRHNHYAMIVTDAQFVITSFNKRAEEMLGYDEREVLGRKTLLLWHDQDQLRERAKFYSDKLQSPIQPDESVLFLVSRKGFLPNWEWTWVSRRGMRMLVSLNTSIIRHPDGTTKGYVLIARDISEIKQAVATNTRLLEIMESAHDMIASFDMRGQIFYLNKAGHAFLGIDTLNEHTQRLNQYMPIPTTVRFAEGLSEARKHGYWQSEIEFITAGGAAQITSITVVAHQTKDDRDIFYSTIVRDISDQKEVQRQLLEAKEEADRANEAKSSFFARMSHEIRTPLNGIIGLTHLLQRSELTDIQSDYLRQVSVSSYNLLGILNDILDFSKLEADKLSLECVPFRLEELLERLSGLFSVLLGPKPVDFIIHSDPRIPDWLDGDPVRLEQVLLNLGSNAIKFTNHGLIELSIEAVELTQRNVHLKFTVKDSGIGMTDEQRERLFMPFVQADEKTSRKYGGTGLGLVISHTLVERMGGSISVQSAYHVGSTFAFDLTLPLSDNRTLTDRAQFPGMKIIVLEDQNQVAEHWRIMLSSFGCEAVALSSWQEAELLLQQSRWDAMIVDMEAGDMHGEETWMDWKSKLNQSGVKVISSTTLLGRDALQLLPADYKPDAVLVKPSSLLLVQQALHVISRSMKGLPIRDIDKAQTAAVLPVADKERTENVRLWVVDDQIINRLVVQQLLSSYGYSADLLESGREAVELLGEGEAQVDLILMDLHMPEMDGIEATALIRRRHSSDKLPIIALTADVTMEMHMRCKEAGMNDIITKPIEPDILLEVIGKWLPSRPSVPSVRPVETELWPDLPGLRPAAALQRLNGKGELYLKLLYKFSQEYSDVRQRLAALLRQGDRMDAVRLVHSLRGAAGHLGAVVIQEAAATMEKMLQSNAPVEEYEQEFYHYLEEGMDSIATLLRRKRS